MASGSVVRPEPGDDGLAGGPWIESGGDHLGAVRSLLAGVVLVMACNGLLRVALGVRAESEDFGLVVTGVVMAGYFLGFLFGTRAAEHFIATVGHIRVFAALAAMGSTSSILHVIWVHPASWTLLRFAYGMCLAGILVTVESWLNDMATNATRGRMLSRYMIVTMGGMGAGQLMLNLADPGGVKLFVLSSALISLALVPVSLSASTRAPSGGPRTDLAARAREARAARAVHRLLGRGLTRMPHGARSVLRRHRGAVQHPHLAVRRVVDCRFGGVPVASWAAPRTGCPAAM